MGERAEDRPEYTWLRELKSDRGENLRRQYGAHAIGIGWKKVEGKKTDQLALTFYVERKRPPDRLEREQIPPQIAFTPSDSGEPVLLLTDVVESAPAKFG